jgi:hypothetical protein
LFTHRVLPTSSAHHVLKMRSNTIKTQAYPWR